MGDFNIDCVSRNFKNISRLFSEYGISFISTSHTRITSKSATTIDYIAVNSAALSRIRGTTSTPVYFSDHHALLSQYKCPRNGHNHSRTTEVYCINDRSSAHFSTLLRSLEVNFSNIDRAYLSLIENTNHAISSSFKTIIRRVRPGSIACLAWWSPEIQKLVCELKALTQQATFDNSTLLAEEIRRKKNYVSLRMRSLKRAYLYDRLKNVRNSPKDTWRILNSFLNKPTSTSTFDALRVDINGCQLSDAELSNKFNHFFITSVNDIVSKFMPYLNNRCVSRNFIGVLPFCFSCVSYDQVSRYFATILSKGPGLNSILPKFLKLAPHYFISHIMYILNQSFVDCRFPMAFKLSRVTPIFKKGDTSIISNYRPISILPSLSKIFERAAHEQIIHYLYSNGLFYEDQHGFRKGHSTGTAILSLLDYIYKAIDAGYCVGVVFLDLSKAFDVICHDILLDKLRNYYNFCDDALSWISSFLSDRRQVVKIGDALSTEVAVSHGVPQGSILGPLLFSLYVGDIVEALSFAHPVLYADDTALVFSACNEVTLIDNVNRDLENMNRYFMLNHLQVNARKSVVMYFNCTRTNGSDVKIDDSIITMVTSFTYLGYVIDDKLSFSKHTDNIASKLSSCNRILQRTRNFLPYHHICMIYNSIGKSYINYSSLILSKYNRTIFHKLNDRYLSVGTVLHNCTKRYLVYHNWPDLDMLLIFYRYMFIYKVMHKNYAPCLRRNFQTSMHNYGTRQNNNLAVTRLIKKSSQNAFYNWSPRLWNLLPQDLKNCGSINIFRISLLAWLDANWPINVYIGENF
jgi:hypothetical protein